MRVETAEAKPMETELVTVDAAEMKKTISDQGHIALYGMLFEFDSAKLLPGSRATIEELLKQSPNLKLHVVGYTDDKGTLKYNLERCLHHKNEIWKCLSTKYFRIKRCKNWPYS